jgi:hypothetical protein
MHQWRKECLGLMLRWFGDSVETVVLGNLSFRGSRLSWRVGKLARTPPAAAAENPPKKFGNRFLHHIDLPTFSAILLDGRGGMLPFVTFYYVIEK